MKVTKELDTKVEKLRELMKQKEEIEKQITEAQEVFKILMGALNTDEIKGETWKITWKTSFKNTIDTKALKADHPEIAEQYNRKTEQRRFLLT